MSKTTNLSDLADVVSTNGTNLQITSSYPKIDFTDTDVPYNCSISANTGHMYYVSHNTNRDHVFTNNSDSRECMRVTGDGYVTMPYQPMFCGRLSATSGFNNLDTLVCQAVGVNNGNHYNTSTGNFTAPVTGHYLITGQLLTRVTGSTSSYASMQPAKNGASLATTHGSIYAKVSEGEINAAGSFIVYANAGDTLSFLTATNGVLNLYGTETGMTVQLVS